MDDDSKDAFDDATFNEPKKRKKYKKRSDPNNIMKYNEGPVLPEGESYNSKHI
jgi:FAD/FMN-containing dehydrogenase